jgi:hypothetical protein
MAYTLDGNWDTIPKDDHFGIITRASYDDPGDRQNGYPPETRYYFKYTAYADEEAWMAAMLNLEKNKQKYRAIRAEVPTVTPRLEIDVKW